MTLWSNIFATFQIYSHVIINTTVILAKCEFAKATVTYLGKVVGQGCVRPIRAKVEAMDCFPLPTTKKGLMPFLGLVEYNQGFLLNLSSVVAPLTDLLQAKAVFVWSSTCQEAFEAAKSLLTSAPVLAASRSESLACVWMLVM